MAGVAGVAGAVGPRLGVWTGPLCEMASPSRLATAGRTPKAMVARAQVATRTQPGRDPRTPLVSADVAVVGVLPPPLLATGTDWRTATVGLRPNDLSATEPRTES